MKKIIKTYQQNNEKENDKINTLKRLYYGKLCPIDDAIPHDMEYRSLSLKIIDEREYFAAKLSKKDRKRFQKWNNLIFRYEDTMEYANFSSGFKLGIMLAFGIFAESNLE